MEEIDPGKFDSPLVDSEASCSSQVWMECFWTIHFLVGFSRPRDRLLVAQFQT